VKIVFCAVVVSLISVIATAHHSRAAYNTDEVTVVEGQLVGVLWRNPHIVFSLKVSASDGGEEMWRMEAGSIYMLKRAGLDEEMFKTGASVQVAGHFSIHEDRDFLANSILFPDGREILTMPTASPHWTGDRLGGRDRWLTDSARLNSTEPEGSGIFKVWSVPRTSDRRALLPFRQSAIAAREQWDLVDNLITRCQVPGMPRIMLGPHPFEFVDQGDRITMLGEEFDMVRTIYIDESIAPNPPEPSNFGLSLGHWEGNAFVVRTTHINWPYFDGIGTPQSENVEVTERYTLSDDERRLDYRFTVTDPSIPSASATYSGQWLALGETVEPYECEVY